MGVCGCDGCVWVMGVVAVDARCVGVMDVVASDGCMWGDGCVWG